MRGAGKRLSSAVYEQIADPLKKEARFENRRKRRLSRPVPDTQLGAAAVDAYFPLRLKKLRKRFSALDNMAFSFPSSGPLVASSATQVFKALFKLETVRSEPRRLLGEKKRAAAEARSPLSA